MAPGDKVLSYGDYILRESDLTILKGKDWLNDTLIGFYFEYLSNIVARLGQDEDDDKQTGDNSSEKKKANAPQFVGPEVTQLLKLISQEEVPIVLDAVLEGMETANFTFFAVNDSNSKIHQGHVGGSHWSLLIYSKTDKRFVHFDSVHKANDDDAQIIVAKLSSFTDNAKFINHVSCKRQSNGYDCGCHVLRNAELISEYVTGGTYPEATGGEELSPIMLPSCPTSTPEDAAEMRSKLISVINKLQKESTGDS